MTCQLVARQMNDLVEGLCHPAAYAHPVESVELVETHISWVFLAGDRAYKVKKPKDLGFLDFTSLADRRRICHDEVRLNRRLADPVYLGVRQILAPPEPRIGAWDDMTGPEEAAEYAVVMRRLPPENRWQVRLDEGRLEAPSLEAWARRLAAFYASAKRGPEVAKYGSLDVVAGNQRENFDQLAPYVGRTLAAEVFERLQARTDAELARLADLVEARAAAGVPRDTHGDLHLDHHYDLPKDWPGADGHPVVAIDCVEFNARFRYADPVADVAFLVMDLFYAGRPDLASTFADAYFEAADDAEGQQLLNLYAAYRAVVRAKIASLRYEELAPGTSEAESTARSASAHAVLALGFLEPPERRPAVVLIGGLPGTGKSTLANALAAAANFSIVATDRVRKELAGLDLEESGGPELYTEGMKARTYQVCLDRARETVTSGGRVLIDATFHAADRREAFARLARDSGAACVFIECQASEAVVRDRLSRRGADWSDADWAVYRTLREAWEPATDARGGPGPCAVDTGQGLDAALAQATGCLRAMGLVDRVDQPERRGDI